jgi:hypothetical protein
MVEPMMTFEEAVEHQREIYARIDAGESIPERVWRGYSMRDGYEFRFVPEYGTGFYSVNIATGDVCEWNGRWSDDGSVLLCQDCFEDGT